MSFEREAAHYDAARGGEERGAAFARDLHPLFSQSGPVLEVGVGTGVVALGLQSLGRPVVGIDIAPAMAARARARIGQRVALADATVLPLADASVADAYSVWVLHLVDIPAVIGEVLRVLVPGGRYVVSGGNDRRVATDIAQVESALFERLRDGPPPDEPGRVIEAGERVGFALVERARGVPQEFEQSPNGRADHIARRGSSILFDVDNTTWNDVVEPAIAAMRALPEPDRPRKATVSPLILVFEKRR